MYFNNTSMSYYHTFIEDVTEYEDREILMFE